jgi:site-specific DNA recombinase
MIVLDFRLDDRNVPVISDLEIDVGAEKLLCDYDRRLLTNPQPLDVEAFAEDYLGLHIHYDNLSHNGCIWGTMIFVNSRIPIFDQKKKRAEYIPVDANTIIIDNSIASGGREEVLHDMTLRLDGLYDIIVELEEKIEDVKLRRKAVEQDAITLENIYTLLANFDKVYDKISDEEKKSLISSLIKEIEIFPCDESELPLKSILFNFPVYKDGGDVYEFLWDKSTHVST